MNTVSFLLSLKDSHEFFNMTNDLEVMLKYFSVEMFDKNYAIGISGQDFPEKLKEDLKNASYEQIKELADFLVSLTNQKHADNTKPLLQMVCGEVRNYIVNHPEQLDVSKYYKIIVMGTIHDIEGDLNKPVEILYSEDKKELGSAISDDYRHEVTISNALNFGSNTEAIYNLYQCMYHEEYHCIVNELIANPDCYKIDILKYQIPKVLREILHDKDKNDEFYDYFYTTLKEETNAELYGIKMAKEKIMEINPQFQVALLTKVFNKAFSLSANPHTAAFKDKVNKTLISQDDFFERSLNQKLLQYPEYVKGSLTRVYNSDGTRKDFLTLLQEWEEARQNKPHLTNDLNDFYSYVIYRELLHMTLDDILKLCEEATYSLIIIDVLQKNQNRLEQELASTNGNKLYAILNFYKDNLNKKVVNKEITNIEEIQKVISQSLSREGENQNVRS